MRAKWTAAKDKLPEKSGLCYCNYEVKYINEKNNIEKGRDESILVWDGDEFIFGSNNDDYVKIDVFYWIQIPELPTKNN